MFLRPYNVAYLIYEDSMKLKALLYDIVLTNSDVNHNTEMLQVNFDGRHNPSK